MIREDLVHLIYLLGHKWRVFVECCKLGIPWRGVFHDLSRFSRREWAPYYFSQFLHEILTRDDAKKLESFAISWNRHKTSNPHHWEYWAPKSVKDEKKLLEIPDGILLEMLADWIACAKERNMPFDAWCKDRMESIRMNPCSREKLEEMILLLNKQRSRK